MHAAIVHCAELGRDLAPILARVPDAAVQLAPRTPGTHAGCIAGHQAIVRQAKREKWSAVFVIEDDCAFTEAFSLEQWEKDVAWAGQNGYNVLVGGCVATRNARRARAGLAAIDYFKSSHCIAYLPSAYDVVLRLVEPMDVMIGKLGAKPLVTVPFVAVQRPSFSGIQQRDVDYLPRYAQHEAHLAALFGRAA